MGSLRSLIKFFTLTFALTWACFIAVIAIMRQTAPAGLPLSVLRELLLYLGIFAPALVALGVTAQERGAADVRALLRRAIQWEAGARWYVFAVAYMAAVKLSVAILHRLLAGSWPPFGHELPGVIIVAIAISTPVQAGEEIGWRGFALPRMASRMGFAGASVVLGLLWAAWHLPIFFMPGADKYGQSFPVWALGVTALSVAIAWLYVHTNGSLLLTMLMHSAINQTVGIVSDAAPQPGNPFSFHAPLQFWLTIALLWLPAVWFLLRMPKAHHLRRDAAAPASSVLTTA
ncbi:MAG TPA: type II CAAX endopeptidase family protein [Candidatus Acidoferrales bacterium]|nr:type II CAAX endopeptidase family protein [Candidatus Acidoferrales bacterium]